LPNETDFNYTNAKKAIADYHGVLSENILLASGAAEVLHIALVTLKPRKVLLPMPTIPLYQEVCKKNGCEIIPFFNEKSNEFDIDVDKLINSSAQADMIIISNPCNPTSRITDRAKMERILDHCQQKGIYLIIDESYIDFVSLDISTVNRVVNYANIIILKTLANYFALRGVRFSYCVSCEGLIELMHMKQITGTVSSIALCGFESLLRDVKYIKKTKAWLMSEPKRFFKIISMLGGITAYKPYANYIFIELEQIPSSVLCERLYNKGIKVCNCNKMGGLDGQYIRISIKDKRSNEKFLDIFSRCLL
jgi:threonine-phosphate decarboxylase